MKNMRQGGNARLKEQARKGLVVGEICAGEIDALYEVLVAHVDRVSSARPHTRAFTDVVFDRAFGGLPIRKSYVSIETMTRDLAGLSVLIHEFTHFWALSGALGGYFTEIAVQLFHLRVSLDLFVQGAGAKASRDPEAVSALRSYFDSRAKLECFWRTWEPWMEGVALFSELDLDLTEPGGEDAPLPISMLLAAFPTSTGGSTGVTGKVDHIIARTRDLQRRAADARLPMSRTILDGRSQIGNEDVYFVGLTLIRFLWRTWARRCSAFENSIVFCRALTWLTHSAFDDLLPDWRCSPLDFAARLQTNYSDFLRRLLNLPGESLREVVEAQKSPKRVTFDFWARWTSANAESGREQSAPDLSEARIARLRQEFKETCTSDPRRRWRTDEILEELKDVLLRNNTLQLLTKSDISFRLDASGRWLFGSLASPNGLRASRLIRTLDQFEFDSLVAERSYKEMGVGQFSQFLLSRPDAEVNRMLSILSCLRYGGTTLVWHVDGSPARDPIAKMVAFFLSQDRKQTGDRIEKLAYPPLDETSEEVVKLFGAFASDSEAATQLAREAIEPLQRIVADHKLNIELLSLLPLTLTEARAEALRKQRLGALLPEDAQKQSQARRLLSHLLGTRSAMSRRDLAKALNWNIEKVNAVISSVTTAASAWGQSLIVEADGAVKFSFPSALDC